MNCPDFSARVIPKACHHARVKWNFCKFKNCKTDAVIIRILSDVSAMLPSSGYTRLPGLSLSLVYPEEGTIAETSVNILIITASVLQFLNLH